MKKKTMNIAAVVFTSAFCLLPSAFLHGQTYINENFNAGSIPNSWTVTTAGCFNSGLAIQWVGTTNGWRGQGLTSSLDNTEFAIVDIVGSPTGICPPDEYLTSPVFNATAATTLLLEFDHFAYPVGTAEVEVFDGSSWVVVASFVSTTGGWMAPDKQSINIAPYKNATMQIRFRYQDAGWYDWFWAVDNIWVAATSPTAVNETSSSDGMEVYPNPTTGKIQVIGNQYSVIGLEVYNVMGEKVYQSLVNSHLSLATPPMTNAPMTIDLSSQPDGIYFIHIKTDNGNIVKKLIIQK